MDASGNTPNIFVCTFWNATENRFRALWRILLTAITMIAISIVLLIPLNILSIENMPKASHIATNIAFVLGVIFAARWIDRRLFSDTGVFFTPRWWEEFWVGMGLGVFLMAVIFAVQYSLGWVTITETFVTKVAGANFWLALLWPILLYVSVGIAEEVVFRGYLFLNVAEGFRSKSISPAVAIWAALIFTSLLFGVAHIFNPEAGLISTLNISLAGVMLGLPYILSGRLAMAIGLHITWNFSEGIIFGFPVSGMQFSSAKFIEISQGGPDSWTGGAFGPEAGLIGLIAMISGMVIMMSYYQFRDGNLRLFTALAEPPENPAINDFVSEEGIGEPEGDHSG